MMTRWKTIAGVLGLLLVLAGTRAIGIETTSAQSTTAGTPAAGDSGTTKETGPDQLYQDFLGKLATNLGETDTARVDQAIRDSLKQVVDDRQAAGDLTADQATALKERIDADGIPIGFVGPGGRGFRGSHGGDMGGDRGHGGFGGWNDGRHEQGDKDTSDENDPQQPKAEATPTV